MRRVLLAVPIALCCAGSAVAQGFGPCASIADPAARLQCYDRQGSQPGVGTQAARSAPSPQNAARAAPGGAPESCTRAAPCTGPRGGRYYFTPSGAKRYL